MDRNETRALLLRCVDTRKKTLRLVDEGTRWRLAREAVEADGDTPAVEAETPTLSVVIRQPLPKEFGDVLATLQIKQSQLSELTIAQELKLRAEMAIRFAMHPGGAQMFDAADRDTLVGQPFGSWMEIVGKAAVEMMNTEAVETVGEG